VIYITTKPREKAFIKSNFLWQTLYQLKWLFTWLISYDPLSTAIVTCIKNDDPKFWTWWTSQLGDKKNDILAYKINCTFVNRIIVVHLQPKVHCEPYIY